MRHESSRTLPRNVVVPRRKAGLDVRGVYRAVHGRHHVMNDRCHGVMNRRRRVVNRCDRVVH